MRGEDLRRKNWGGSEARDGCKMCQSEWDDHKVFGKDHYNEIEEVLMHMEVCLFPLCKYLEIASCIILEGGKDLPK